MVLFDIFTMLVWFYLFSNLVWSNLFKIIIISFLYVTNRLGILQKKLSSLSELNPVTKKYYVLTSDKCDKLMNQAYNLYTNDKTQKVLKFTKEQVMFVYALFFKYLQMSFDSIEKHFRKNEKVESVFSELEKKLKEIKNKMNQLKKMVGQIDIKQIYDTIKQFEAMQKQMSEMAQTARVSEIDGDEHSDSYTDDDIFEDNKDEQSKESCDSENKSNEDKEAKKEKSKSKHIIPNMPNDLPPLPPGLNNNFMADLFKSMPPELLEQSMKETQNMDMSKIDIEKMMSDMNQMMGQINQLQNLQNHMGEQKISSRKLNRKLNKKKKNK